MGCTSGRYAVDRTCRVFRVHNVDDQGNKLSPGKLEVTEVDLVLYQTGKEAIRWPLRCLRRYGFDADLFSFESGRRCPTGQGIYAFCCRNAEDLFNLVQESIKDEQNRTNHNFIATSSSASRLPTSSRPTSTHLEAYETGHDVLRHGNANNSLSVLRGDAALPNGDASHLYVNTGADDHNYVNTELAIGESHGDNVLVDFLENPDDGIGRGDDLPRSLRGLDIKIDDLNLNLLGYSQVSNVRPVSASLNAHESLGKVVPVSSSSSVTRASEDAKSRCVAVDDNGGHNYANISLADAEPPKTAKPCCPVQMNYIQLDLARSTENLSGAPNGFAGVPSPTSPVTLTPLPESPTRTSVGYAQIDFNKTNALQMSNCNKNQDPSDDGVRKTRHNSTIADK